MAVVTYRALRCDTPQCDTEWVEHAPVWTDRELRDQMRDRGWTRRRRDGRMADLCPDCTTGQRGPHYRKEAR